MVVAHIGIIVFVDVDVRDLLEIALTDGVDDVNGSGGASDSIAGILVAGSDIDLASIG